MKSIFDKDYVYNEDKVIKEPQTAADKKAEAETSVKGLDSTSAKYKDMYKFLAPIAYNGYIQLKPEDHEVIEALQILREAGVFDITRYIANSQNVTAADENFVQMQSGDYKLMVSDWEEGNVPPHIKQGGTPTEPPPTVIPDPDNPDTPIEDDYWTPIDVDQFPKLIIVDDIIAEKFKSIITFADIEYSVDLIKLGLPTTEELFLGYTTNPKYKSTSIGALGPTIEYNGSGINSDGTLVGTTMEDILNNKITEQNTVVENKVLAGTNDTWVEDLVKPDIPDSNSSTTVTDTENRDSDIHQRNIFELLMSRGDKDDLLSTIGYLLSENMKRIDESENADLATINAIFDRSYEAMSNLERHDTQLFEKILETRSMLLQALGTPNFIINDGDYSTKDVHPLYNSLKNKNFDFNWFLRAAHYKHRKNWDIEYLKHQVGILKGSPAESGMVG